jgi:peptidoglycan LD-endopeptidase CwlK
MRKWSDRSLRNLAGIHPDLRRVMDRALQISPIDFIVIEGLRTKERQAQLVADGASRTMNSRHLTGHAVDLLPIGSNGKGEFAWPLYHKLAPAVKQAAKELGVAIVWGGDWPKFRDGPHFELDRKVYPAGVPFVPAAAVPDMVIPISAAAPVPPPPEPPALGTLAWLFSVIFGGFRR